MTEPSDVSLSLPKDLRERTDAEIVRRVVFSVDACKRRDQLYREYAAQVDNLDTPWDNGPWQNSSVAEDPLTLEQGSGLASYFMAALQGEPPALITAINEEDSDLASDLEAAFGVMQARWDTRSVQYDLAHNAAFYPSAPVRVSWITEYGKHRYIGQFDPETHEEYNEDNPAPEGVFPQSMPAVRRIPLRNKPDVRAILPGDYYLYPPKGQDHEKCEQNIERVMYTRADILNGSRLLKFDKQKTAELVAGGPTVYDAVNEVAKERDLADGIEGDGREGEWECFIVTGSIPMLVDEAGKLETPEHLLDENFEWLVCPARNIVFRFGPAADVRRPYNAANMFRYPGRMDGRCVTSMMQVFQERLTQTLRLEENVGDLTNNPGWWAPATSKQYLDGMKLVPGKVDFYGGPGPPVPKTWDMAPFQALLERKGDIRQRANDLMGAGQGITQLSAKSNRSKEEISQVGDSSIMRRDLYLQTFLECLDWMYQREFELWIAHLGEQGEIVLADDGRPIEVKKFANAGQRFVVRAHSNSMAGNPELRHQIASMKLQIVMQYLGSLLQFPPMYWPQIYHATRSALASLDARDAMQLLGPPPNAGDAATTLLQLGQMFSQMQQSKDPNVVQVAQQAVQVIQQGMMQSNQNALPPAGQTADQGMQVSPMAAQQGGHQGGGGVQPSPHSALAINVGPTGLVAAPMNGVKA